MSRERSTIREKWNIFIASDSPAANVPGARASRYRDYGVIGLHIFFFFDFIPWKPTDTWPRDRCGRAQLVLLPSLADFLHLGADL